MHEKIPSLHRGSYKANLLKMAELDGERNFFERWFLLVLKKVDFWCDHDEACARKKDARLTTQ